MQLVITEQDKRWLHAIGVEVESLVSSWRQPNEPWSEADKLFERERLLANCKWIPLA